MGSEDAVLGRQVFVAQPQLLIDEAGHKGQKGAQWNRSLMANVYDRPLRDPAMRRSAGPAGIFTNEVSAAHQMSPCQKILPR